MKRFMAIILLGVFLIPSVGMMIYVHNCNMSKAVIIELDQENACCSKVHHDHQHHSYQTLDHNESIEYTGTIITELPCCKNSKVYIKLGSFTKAESFKAYTGFIPVLINIYNQAALSSYYCSNSIPSNEYPPGITSIIEYTYLRI